MSRLHYLPNAAIDKAKWDSCIQRSPNGLIYASSIFLDYLAHNWDGIVAGDYEFVFPIPWKSKFGIRYVTPPVFTQQLGLIGPASSETILQEAVQLMQKHFRYGEYLFNFKNQVTGLAKNNFILSLKHDYEAIENNFESDLKYDIRKALSADQTITTGNHRSLIGLYRQLYSDRFHKISPKDYKNLEAVFDRLAENKMLICRCAFSLNELIAGIICVNDEKRIYLLLTASSAVGRKNRSIQLLVDNVIREFAGQNLIFDFEGSDIPGISHFFRSFGSVNQPYMEYRWNDLPFPLNILKKRITKKELHDGSA